MPNPTYSLVIAVYNEEDSLPELANQLRSLMEQLDGPSEVIFVDDGSKDASYPLMLEISATDPRFKIVELSRNFGQHAALAAGVDRASGEAVVIMDADLQDPPEVVLEMAAHWREGYQVVHAARKKRQGDGLPKRATAWLFYRILRRLTDIEIPTDSSEFRLIDRQAVEAFKACREHSRYTRGMITWVGFNQVKVRYSRPKRYAGKSKWRLFSLVKVAMDGILSFSMAPLRLASCLGLVAAMLAFLGGVLALLAKLLIPGFFVPGLASLVLFLCLILGVQFLLIGILGEYIGRIYEEAKNRPLYVVSRTHGLAESESTR